MPRWLAPARDARRRIAQFIDLLRPAAKVVWRDARGRCRQAAGSAIDLLFPPACALCERLLGDAASESDSGEDCVSSMQKALLCGDCRRSFKYRSPRICPRCAAPLAPLSQRRDCPECTKRKLPFAGSLALGEYRGKLREAVLRTKKSAHESLTMQLGAYLAQRTAREAWAAKIDVVVPLPSHWWRRWTRGTSGPELLAYAVAEALNRPVVTRAVRCVRRTRKQGMLRPREREQNVRGAFEVVRPEAIAKRCVLLVDDVMTTGATLREVARCLRRAGAKRVYVAVLARGTGD